MELRYTRMWLTSIGGTSSAVRGSADAASLGIGLSF